MGGNQLKLRYVYICVSLIFLLTSCDGKDIEPFEVTDKQDIKVTKEVEKSQIMDNLKVTRNDDLKQEKHIRYYSNFILSTESIIREGHLTNIEITYPQLYMLSSVNNGMELKKSFDKANKLITDKIFYNEMVMLHTKPFEANVTSNVTVLSEEMISISFEGNINDDGVYHQFLSSLTYNINNGEDLYLFDVIKSDHLLELLCNESLEIYPNDFADNNELIKDLFIDKINNAKDTGESINNFFLTEEYIVLYTELSPNLNEFIQIKIPYTY